LHHGAAESGGGFVSSPPFTDATGRIDVHCHLLPGIDDGCKTAEESIECARALVAAGYTHAFCTPHIWPTYKGVSRVSVPRWCAALQSELAKADVPLTLLPGGEMNLYLGVDKTPAEEVVPLGLGRYMLVDMWTEKLPDFFEPTIRWLQGMGLTVILAHPERMRIVQDEPGVIEYFKSLGMLLQGNLQCFSDPPESLTRRCADQFLLDGRYFLLGSDTHNPGHIDRRIMGLENAIELVGDAKVDELTIIHPKLLAPQCFGKEV
jgi:protein-tyrosine phosphatase